MSAGRNFPASAVARGSGIGDNCANGSGPTRVGANSSTKAHAQGVAIVAAQGTSLELRGGRPAHVRAQAEAEKRILVAAVPSTAMGRKIWQARREATGAQYID